MTTLPIINIIKAAFATISSKDYILVRILIFPIFLTAILQVIILFFQDNILVKIPLYFLLFFIYILMAVKTHRVVILKESSKIKYNLFSWFRREAKYAIKLITINIAVYLLPSISLMTSYFFFTTSLSSDSKGLFTIFLPLITTILTLISSYFFARLCLLLPATAIGKEPSFRWAWNVTKHNGVAILFTTVLIPTTLSILASSIMPSNASFIGQFVSTIIESTLLIIGILILSLTFEFVVQEIRRLNNINQANNA